MKKRFKVPIVFLTAAEPQDGGGGSLIGGFDSIKPFPAPFSEWMQSRFCGDYDHNDTVDFNDYAKWWAQNGFGAEAWSQYNPDTAWSDEWLS